ncbi:MAG: MAE_28990/MAE_18760 family HEPN-like nuclease [Streptosporangiaceae bacterium]
MTSRAEASFVKNCEDIEELLKIHTEITGEAPGRRRKIGALHKSAIVLLTAFWEAFCEDLAAEALQHVVANAPNAEVLPAELRKQVAKELEEHKNNLAVWELADDGWRSVLVSRLARLQEQRNRWLNNPTTQKINDLFSDALGIEKISESWHWNKMTAQRAAEKLDEFIIVRHEVAHRGSSADRIWKYDVNEYYNHAWRLVEQTAAEIARVLADTTGVVPWPDEATE